MEENWKKKKGGSVGGKIKSDPYANFHIVAGRRNKSGATNEPMRILKIISVLWNDNVSMQVMAW